MDRINGIVSLVVGCMFKCPPKNLDCLKNYHMIMFSLIGRDATKCCY